MDKIFRRPIILVALLGVLILGAAYYVLVKPHGDEQTATDPAAGERVTIREIRPGDAAAPPAKPGRVVTLHYTAWLYSGGEKGAQIDSSRDRDQPFKLKAGTGQVMPGWDQAVEGMQPGAVREVVIPASLAYGDKGAGALVPPGSDLIFEFEVLAVE